MFKALRVNTDGTTERVTINKYEDINEIVGGLFDVTRGRVYVNDEGLMIGLPYNVVASAYAFQTLVGDALITGGVDEEGYDLDITDEDAEEIEEGAREFREAVYE